MKPKPQFKNSTRLQTLLRYQILDSSPEASFSDLARLAAQICGVPIAALIFGDGERQWVKASVGLGAAELEGVFDFCQRVVQSDQAVSVADIEAADLQEAARASRTLLVWSDARVRWFVGVPLLAPSGEAVGTLCVLDTTTRPLTPEQFDGLQLLARQAMTMLELRATSMEQSQLPAQNAPVESREVGRRSGRMQRLANTVVDVSGQHEAERALRASEKRFSSLFNSAAAGITLSQPYGNYLQSNPAFCAMVGYREDELQELDDLALTHPEDRAQSKEMVEKLLRGEVEHFVLEKRFLKKSGEVVWARVSISGVHSEHNELLYIICVSEDITERVQAQTTASSLAQRLALTLEHMTDAFCLLDRDWRVNYLNKEAERLVLHSSKEMMNVKLWDRFPPTMGSVLYTEFHRSVSTNEPVHFELYYPPLKNWFEVHAYPMPDGLAIYFRVITERKIAEDALRESEERFRQMAETIEDVFWIWDPVADRILYASPRYEVVFGRSREELYRNSRDFVRSIHPDDRARLIEAVARDAYSIQVEYRVAHENRKARWVSVRTFPVHDDHGKVRHSVGIARDITQLMETAEQLRASEEQYRLLFANNPHPMWVYDSETLRFLAVNAQAVARYGYSEEEFLAMTIGDIRPAEESAKRERALATTGMRQNQGIWRHRKKDGSLIDVEVSSNLIQFNGRTAGLALATDITARRRAEEQVRQQAALLDKAQDAIMVHDLNHCITYWNRGAERLYGWNAGEAIGRQANLMLYRDPSSLARAHQQLMFMGEWNGEMQQVDRQGRELLVEVRWTLVRDEEGLPQAVLSITTDITERRKLEAQFWRAQRMESIGTLAGGIAHDLNNVLAPILLSLGMLKRLIRTPAEQKLLGTLESSAQRGADMVRQVLTFARGVEGERLAVDVGKIVRELENLIRETFDRSISFQVRVADELLPILGDPTQIHQVLLNLCVNARDAMPDGGELVVDVSTIYLDSPFASMDLVAEPGHYVVLRVTDTGIGIPAEIRDRIFDPFFTTKDVGKGTGLGLPTVQAVIKSHGGFINVYSEEGRGTEFKVYLPALESKAVDETADVQEEAVASDGALILVIDDEPAIRIITQQTLESFGYRVLTAEGGREAIALYAAHKEEIAVVLTDMMMPGMDGFAIMQELRQLNPQVKIIAASGLAAHDTVTKATKFGVTHFLQKPYTTESLLKVLGDSRVENAASGQ